MILKWNDKISNFVIRLFIVYMVQLMIKGFDYSFGHFFDFTFRGLVFSTTFITFWLLIWYLAEWVNDRIKHRGELVKLLINLMIGYSAGFVSNNIYRFIDVYFFGKTETWKDISIFNPELVVALLMIYMIVYGVYEYLNVKLQKKDEQLKKEKLQKENIFAQYQSLKNQIEPHFLFNSLSVLSSIVHTDSNLASEFIVKLSKTMRFIIEKNKFDLVTLNDEMAMVKDYFFLLKTRFNDGIHLQLLNDIENVSDVYIPPVSIQLLIENAIKHNKLSAAEPIHISICICDNHICVKNTLNRKTESIDSTGIGLNNISKRYELIANKQVITREEDDLFIVKLPILNQEDYENFNY
ncbi:sensor histidine kinase [Lentimicrobium sp. S6]|uniref:sensor histidine kinase n=1 Tax=Lentimicrobium sp. S6 TaxID=2735872 RepID=UPI0015580705|nr:histidine kinase [Lentimicrobium sp. S6]NPD45856.1 histidine kinase [Lentimicrobium sp. S6]